MASLNKWLGIGNLTRDPEIKYTPSGKAVCQIGLAVNESYKTASGEKREEVLFVDVELWGKLAEIAGEYLKKGRSVFIEGKLRLDSWDDKQSGQKRSKLKVVGEMMQMLGGKDGGQGGQQQAAPAQRPANSSRQYQAQPAPDPDLDEGYRNVMDAPGVYDEFQRHCSVVLGKPVKDAYPFSCSC